MSIGRYNIPVDSEKLLIYKDYWRAFSGGLTFSHRVARGGGYRKIKIVATLKLLALLSIDTLADPLRYYRTLVLLTCTCMPVLDMSFFLLRFKKAL